MVCSMSQHLLFRSLGLNLALADPPEGDRLQILNEAWKVITKLKNPQVGDLVDLRLTALSPSYAVYLSS